MMLDLRKPFGADVLKRRRTHHTEADKKHVRLHNTHDNTSQTCAFTELLLYKIHAWNQIKHSVVK